MKWNWTAFFIKVTSRQFWVWITTTAVVFYTIVKDGDHGWITPIIIVWGVITGIYLCGSVVVDAIGKAIGNADIDVTIGAPKTGGGR
jgi:hypothetical protein